MVLESTLEQNMSDNESLPTAHPDRKKAPVPPNATSIRPSVAGDLFGICAEALRGAHGWEQRVGEMARRIGRQWVERHDSVEPLLADAHHVIASQLDEALIRAEDADPAERRQIAYRINRLTAQVTTELLAGCANHESTTPAALAVEASPLVLAGALLSGRARAGVQDSVTLAPAYGVVSVHAPKLPGDVLEREFRQHGRPGTLSVFDNESGHVLVPVGNLDGVAQLCRRLHVHLDGPVWIAIAHKPLAEIPAGRELADDILTVAVTVRLPGVYQFQDVMVEYASATTPVVSEYLINMIQPVMAQPILRHTLKTLIAADGNRSRASEMLIIHRSTVDYRLQRIEAITGQNPSSRRGLNLLTNASAAYALHHRQLKEF